MADKEYIEKEAAIELLRDNINLPIDSGTARAYWTRVVEIKDALIGYIAKIPAADVAEVRHGEWKMSESGAIYFCNKCKYLAMPREARGWNFCPNCGARMDGGKHG